MRSSGAGWRKKIGGRTSVSSYWKKVRDRSGGLTTSVEKLAISIEGMVKEQEVQGARLEALEGRDGKMWRAAVSYTITAVIGVVIGFIFNQLGM